MSGEAKVLTREEERDLRKWAKSAGGCGCNLRWHRLFVTLDAERARADAAEADAKQLVEVVEYAKQLTRGLGEHGPSIVMANDAAEDARWTGDPGFVTNLKECWRVMGNAIADAIEKRAAVSALDGEGARDEK